MTSRANVDPLQREKLSKNFFCCRLRKRKMKNCFSFVEEWLLEFFSGTLAFLKQHLSEVFGQKPFFKPSTNVEALLKILIILRLAVSDRNVVDLVS